MLQLHILEMQLISVMQVMLIKMDTQEHHQREVFLQEVGLPLILM